MVNKCFVLTFWCLFTEVLRKYFLSRKTDRGLIVTPLPLVNNYCRITIIISFLSFCHSLHFARFYIFMFNNSFPIFVTDFTAYPFFSFSSNVFVGWLFIRVKGVLLMLHWTFSQNCLLLKKKLNLCLELWLCDYLKNEVLTKFSVL